MIKTSIIVHGAPQASVLDHFRRRDRIIVTEGRPSLESSRWVCKQLLQKGNVPTVICDNMAGFLFHQKLVKEVRTAYYRREGQEVLCDIGALILAILCQRHRVPMNCYPGRNPGPSLGRPQDLYTFQGHRVAAAGVSAYVPLLEWVPLKYVRNIYG